LFRLQRHGIVTPKLLAVGQRFRGLGRVESFLITEPLPGISNLADWLSDRAGAADWRQREEVVRRTAEVLRRMHEAGCYFAHQGSVSESIPLFVQDLPGKPLTVVMGDVARLRTCKRARRAAERDLRLVQAILQGLIDESRLLRHYLQTKPDAQSPMPRQDRERVLPQNEVAA